MIALDDKEEVGKVHAAQGQAYRWHDDVLDQRRDDAGEGGADNDTDRQVDDSAAHGEFLEFLEHEMLPGPIGGRLVGPFVVNKPGRPKQAQGQ